MNWLINVVDRLPLGLMILDEHEHVVAVAGLCFNSELKTKLLNQSCSDATEILKTRSVPLGRLVDDACSQEDVLVYLENHQGTRPYFVQSAAVSGDAAQKYTCLVFRDAYAELLRYRSFYPENESEKIQYHDLLRKLSGETAHHINNALTPMLINIRVLADLFDRVEDTKPLPVSPPTEVPTELQDILSEMSAGTSRISGVVARLQRVSAIGPPDQEHLLGNPFAFSRNSDESPED